MLRTVLRILLIAGILIIALIVFGLLVSSRPEPPWHVARVWPIVSNTQGGPVHDHAQRVLDPYGEPIPRLYAAGELGSVFGRLYLSGGNLAECFIGGRIAGCEAAAQRRQRA